jgi:hypothetical protein
MGHVARMGEMNEAYNISLEDLKEGVYLEYVGVDWCSGFIWFRIGTCGELL